MTIEPLRLDLERLIAKHKLVRKFSKQKRLFEENPRHPSLNTENLHPKSFNIYSFRIDKKWRAIFIVKEDRQTIEIVDINPHYE